jgi:hydrogenase expression/formation protein HypE
MPVALSAAFIIEEGLPLETLDRIAASMGEAARKAGVPIVTGDTKVVERGAADGLFITTTGIGIIPEGVEIAPQRIAHGDPAVGHAGRPWRGDPQPAAGLASARRSRATVRRCIGWWAICWRRCRRLPVCVTLRGAALSATLNELAEAAGVGMTLREAAIPVRPEVAGACELLGLDPIHIANEGKLVCICPDDQAEAVLSIMRAHPEGRDAVQIGTVGASMPPARPDCCGWKR